MFAGSALSLTPSIASRTGVPTQQLPEKIKKDIDHGWAWVVMFAAFMGMAIANGMCYTVGVYIVEFLEIFGEGRAKTAWIGSTLPATTCFTALLASVITKKISCRVTIIFGAFISATGVFLSSLATSVDYLIITYGFITGLGFGLVYMPVLYITGQYFDKRRNLANGFVHTGTGVGIFLISPLLQFLIEKYSWRGAMIIQSGLCLNLLVVAAMLKPMPVQDMLDNQSNQSIDNSKTKTFLGINTKVALNRKLLIYAVSHLCIDLLSSAVHIHLVDYAVLSGTVPSKASILMSVMGLTTIFWRIFFGLAANSPDIDERLIHIGCTMLVAVAVYLIPVFFGSYGGQLLFAVLFGTYFSGPVIMLSSLPLTFLPLEHLGTAIGIVQIGNGAGYLSGAVIAGAIYDETQIYAYSFYFAGTCGVVSALLVLFLPISCKQENIDTVSETEKDNKDAENPKRIKNSITLSVPVSVNGKLSASHQEMNHDGNDANVELHKNGKLTMANGHSHLLPQKLNGIHHAQINIDTD